MDISQYVKKTGYMNYESVDGKLVKVEEEIVPNEDIARLLDAKNGKVHVFAVVSSIYNDEKDIPGGFFSRAYNTEHLLSKNFEPALSEFDKLKEYLQKEHSFRWWDDSYVAPDKRKIKKDSSSNIAKAKFNILYDGSFEGFPVMFKTGLDAMTYGDKIVLAINSAYLSVHDIKYSREHKALCWTYEDYITNYVPIVLD